jgi:hypothetical protein
MRKIFFLLVTLASVLVSCEGPAGPEGPAGRDGYDGLDGLDGNANVYYSGWIQPNNWQGEPGDWYYTELNKAITKDIVESGVILAYISFAKEPLVDNSVRPLPTIVGDVNWSFLLIPQYEGIQLICNSNTAPPLTGIEFRFVLIPSNIQVKKSGSVNQLNIEELKTLPYSEVCKKLNIPE